MPLLETYIRSNPDDGLALSLLGSAYMSQGKAARATQVLQEAIKKQDRPEFRTALGLSLLGYAVNVFIFAMGRLWRDAPPLLLEGSTRVADPLPQALVLTAIVISFATTALLLVVLLAARGLTGTDHVDGRETDQ